MCQKFLNKDLVRTGPVCRVKAASPDFFEISVRVPGALDRVVRHCLEKNPDERFQSARDLAFDLGSLSGLTSQAQYRHKRSVWPITGKASCIPISPTPNSCE